jgi:hypothetical protein
MLRMVKTAVLFASVIMRRAMSFLYYPATTPFTHHVLWNGLKDTTAAHAVDRPFEKGLL